MKVRLTRVGQMTSLGRSRCHRRPRISYDQGCDYGTQKTMSFPSANNTHALSEFRPTSLAPDTGKGGELRVNPSLLHSPNPLPHRRPSISRSVALAGRPDTDWNAELTHSPWSLGTSIPSSSRSPQGTSVEAHLNPLSKWGDLKQMPLT